MCSRGVGITVNNISMLILYEEISTMLKVEIQFSKKMCDSNKQIRVKIDGGWGKKKIKGVAVISKCVTFFVESFLSTVMQQIQAQFSIPGKFKDAHR